VFTDIYQNNRWGGCRGEYYSGDGSDEHMISEFVSAVRGLIQCQSIRSVVDLGCGDFRVGSQIVSEALDYTGIDIVAPLIERNNSEFISKKVRFLVRNIIDDQLPVADLCIIRQVLQHLSNEQIARILNKASAFSFVVIAEHHPAPTRVRIRNLNKAAGSDVRVLFDSGVYLETPPFGLRNLSVLCRTPVTNPLVHMGEIITTYLIDNR
jgi:SAM-dependent methyltransferase